MTVSLTRIVDAMRRISSRALWELLGNCREAFPLLRHPDKPFTAKRVHRALLSATNNHLACGECGEFKAGTSTT